MPTVAARVMKVEHDIGTGWYRITTDHAEIKRLDTKIREKAEEAASLKQEGVLAEIEYSSNPRTVDGRTYQNFRWERGAPSGNGGQQAQIPGIETVAKASDEFQRRMHPDERWKMALQGGAHLAVETLPYLDPAQRSFEHQKQIAIGWASFLMTTPPTVAQSGDPMAASSRAYGWDPSDDPGPEQRPAPTDDDIPF